MRSEQQVLERPGASLAYDVHAPEAGEPTAVVHVVHGLAEHAARYRRLAQALTGRGWVVYAHDQRGHGRSAKTTEALGHLGDEDGWGAVVADLRAFVELSGARHPGRPRAVVAHSMGSLVLQDYLSRYQGGDLTAAALSGTSGPPPAVATLGRLVARVERLRQGREGRSALIDKLAFGRYNQRFEPARTAFDWLSRDPEEVDRYVNDPWCGFRATNETWVQLLDALPRLSRPAALARIPRLLPIYLFSGEADPVGVEGAGVTELARRYRDAGLADVTVQLYPEARHEVLNETHRDEVTDQLLTWLGGRLVAGVTAGNAAAV